MRRSAADKDNRIRVVALCGGVGGAKLAKGFACELGDSFAVIVNTGDDFEHLGLYIAPDLDSVAYRLAGLNDETRGWGRADETWSFMETIRQLGGEDWFQLGDRDLALHVERTRRLRVGESLTSATEAITKQLGISARVLPMSDQPVRTLVESDEGVLPFQRYFVQRRCAPTVRALQFEGAERAELSRAALGALSSPDLEAIVICPSNPYLSVDPILATGGMRDLLANRSVPVIAVSPLIGGKAVKGPTAKIMSELGVAANSRSISQHYLGLIDGLVLDCADVEDRAGVAQEALICPTLMRNDEDSRLLARNTLDFARGTGARRRRRMAGSVQ